MRERSVRQRLAWITGRLHGETLGQLLRYGSIGFASNSIGYLLYLLATYWGAPPKTTMSVLYCAGVFIGFLGNRGLTFSYHGGVWGSGVRYALSYLVGYFINLGLLIVFVDLLGYPHELMQAVAIFVVAAFLFLALKFFVFKSV